MSYFKRIHSLHIFILRCNLMKNLLFLIGISLCIPSITFSQFNIGTNSSNSDAVLQVVAADSTQGIIIPVVSTSKRPTASATIRGMVVYNATDSAFEYCTGYQWITINGDASNLYSDNGTLLGARVVDMNGNNLSFNNGGNVGIGTTSPGFKLHIHDSLNNVLQSTLWNISDSGQSASGLVVASSSNLSHGGRLGVYNIDGNKAWKKNRLSLMSFSALDGVSIVSSDNSTSGDIEFWPKEVQSMTIQGSTGNVGIGTTSPSDKFHVTNSVNDVVATFETTNGGGYSGVDFKANNTDWTLYNSTSINNSGGTPGENGIGFYHNSAYQMVIDHEGNVGVGIEDPNSRLQVLASNLTTTLWNGNTYNAISVNPGYEDPTGLSTIDRDGVSGGNDADGVLFWGDDADDEFRIGPIDGTGTLQERIRITYSGNVGIGTTSPSYPLTVESSNPPAMFNRYSSSGFGANIFLGTSRNASIGSHTIVQENDGIGNFVFRGSNGSGYSNGAAIGAFVDGTPGASNDMPGRLGFSTTPDGSSIALERMRITSTGNVGIGTTAPDEKLHVAGSIKMVDGNQGAGKVLISDANGVASWGSASGTTDSDWVISGSDMYSGVSGNVGIGNQSPNYKLDLEPKMIGSLNVGMHVDTNGIVGRSIPMWLDIEDNRTFSGIRSTSGLILRNLDLTDSNSISLTFTGQAANGVSYLAANISTVFTDREAGTGSISGDLVFTTKDSAAISSNTAERMRITHNGKVGIGTETPEGRFEVRLDKDLTSDSVFVVGENGNVGIGTTSPTTRLFVEHEMGLTGTYNNIASLNRKSSGVDNAGILIGYRDNSTSIEENYIYFNGENKLNSILGSNSGVVGLMHFDPATQNAGIGTNSALPTSRLQIVNSIGSQSVFSLVNSSSDTMLFADDNGNVGIGTTSPLGDLHIQRSLAGGVGQTPIALGNDLIVERDGGNVGMSFLSRDFSEQHIYFGDVSDSAIGEIAYDHSSNSMLFRTNGSETTIIDANGNVGIGTTSPTNKLSLENGDVDFTKYSNDVQPNYFYQRKSRGTAASPASVNSADFVGISRTQAHDGTSFQTATDVRSQVITMNGTNDFETALSFWTRASGTTFPSENMRLNQSGYLGIGSTAPTARLHVRNSGTEDILLLTDNGGAVMNVKDGGNVGIGTTSPDSKLEVVGGIEFGNETNTLSGSNSLVGGGGNVVSGNNSAAAGSDNTVSGNNSFAFGQSGTITDFGSLAIGNASNIGGSRSFAGGNNATIGAGAYISFAFGNYATVDAAHFESFATGNNATTTGSRQFVSRYAGGYRLYSNNTAGVSLATSGTAWASISDRRSKNSIEDISYGLETIMALKPSKYFYNGSDKVSLGFIAQDVQYLVPEVIDETGMGPNNDYLGIKYTELIPILTKAIQELNAKNEVLQQQVDNLSAENTDLQSKVLEMDIVKMQLQKLYELTGNADQTKKE